MGETQITRKEWVRLLLGAPPAATACPAAAPTGAAAPTHPGGASAPVLAGSPDVDGPAPPPVRPPAPGRDAAARLGGGADPAPDAAPAHDAPFPAPPGGAPDGPLWTAPAARRRPSRRDVPLVKLCGLSRPQDVAAANAAAPDLAGFVVDVPRSRRSVSSDALRRLAAQLDLAIAAVGVFVDAPVARVAALATDGAIDVAQLHGHEDEAYLAELRARSDVPVIQAFRVEGAADVERANVSSAELVLLDNGTGGTGRRFDWRLLGDVRRPFMLAGGLTPRNVAAAIAQARPWGVDMSSGIETDGRKDPEKMLSAVAAVRGAAGRR